MNSPDLLRRFTPTPLTADLRIMRRRVRLETNSDRLLQQTLGVFDSFAESRSVEAEFLWRIVTESGADVGGRWPELQAFTDGTLSAVNVERAGFIAVDRAEHEAVGFIAEELARDASGFRERFLPTLLTLTAQSLGLMPVSAACLARSGRGVLVFGKQDDIRMAFDRWAPEPEPCAEGIAFLEMTDRGLQAWSEFWPLSPHDQTERPFGDPLPTAPTSANRIDGPFGGGRLQRSALGSRPVSAVSCVFIEDDAGAVVRARLQPCEAAARLETAGVVYTSKSSQASEALIREALVSLPAYRLSSRMPTEDAAVLFQEVFGGHDLVEASR